MSDRPAAPEGCANPARGQDLEAYLDGRLTMEREAAFEEHYFACPACLEMIRIRQALPSALETVTAPSASASRPRSLALYRALAVAATIALVLLAYPAFLGLRRLPRAVDQARTLGDENTRLRAEFEQERGAFERELADLRESTEWTGAVPLLALRSGSRGPKEPQADLPILAIRPGQPYVPLGVVPGSPDEASDTLRFELLRDDRVVWTSELRASEIRQLRSGELVTFLVPSAVFPTAGEMTLRQPGATGPLLEVRFRVRLLD